MLNPYNDRLDYGEILIPPIEYSLDFAVGTTYSLDLDALIGASLALGSSEEPDSKIMNNPMSMLVSLQRTGDKIALFCENGQIHLPNKTTSLYILLEKMVFPVKTAKNKKIAAYPSFHPKFWLIRYKNKSGEILYRIAVLSRNLTFDRSWDVAFYMDGTLQRKAMRKNKPLCDFVQYLIDQIYSDDENAKNKKKKLHEIIKELPNIQFKIYQKGFRDYEFIPCGVKKSNEKAYCFYDTSLFKETFHEILIMSPFLSADIIRNFNDRNKNSRIQNARYMLFTREISLGKLKPEDVSNFSIYTMKDNVIDGETAISDDSGAIQRQDIHAKMFMIRKSSDTSLYLGSLNASHNAVYGNVEFMIRLLSKNRYLNLDSMANSLFGGKEDSPDNPFQQAYIENAVIIEDEDKTNDLNKIIKEISRSSPNAYVKEDGEYYSVKVHFPNFKEIVAKGYRITVRPLLSNKSEDFGENVIFSKIPITQLSEFYAVSVSDTEMTVERVLIIQTDGLPDNREKAVIKDVVSDEDCFYRYISLLLDDDIIPSASANNPATGDSIDKAARKKYIMPALYEKMLKTVATNPYKFREIEDTLNTLSEDESILKEFKNLYDTFKKAAKLNDQGSRTN